mgnify:FL=1|tara:strand:+ start:75 stop:317 length:243 start_codon:yes stop_codon:yes gene_type:complete
MINDRYTIIFIKPIPRNKSEINNGIIGRKTPNNLLLIFFEEKRAIPVIGAKFGGCGTILDITAKIMILAISMFLFLSFLK